MWPTQCILHDVLLIQDGASCEVFAEGVLELLQQKDDSNDSMSRGEESDLYCQLQVIQVTNRSKS